MTSFLWYLPSSRSLRNLVLATSWHWISERAWSSPRGRACLPGRPPRLPRTQAQPRRLQSWQPAGRIGLMDVFCFSHSIFFFTIHISCQYLRIRRCYIKDKLSGLSEKKKTQKQKDLKIGQKLDHSISPATSGQSRVWVPLSFPLPGGHCMYFWGPWRPLHSRPMLELQPLTLAILREAPL